MEIHDNFFTAWNGWTDKWPIKEGQWTSVINESEILSNNFYEPWYFGEPNGGIKQNCGNIDKGGRWGDISCFNKYCTICNAPTYQKFIMRGNNSYSNCHKL